MVTSYAISATVAIAVVSIDVIWYVKHNNKGARYLDDYRKEKEPEFEKKIKEAEIYLSSRGYIHSSRGYKMRMS